ncbi:MAG: hypothetical protein DMG05_14605, partial [Acidobacteria bacterium]
MLKDGQKRGHANSFSIICRGDNWGQPLNLWVRVEWGIEFEGASYHVTARGNERMAVVRDDQDRQRFLDRLGSCVTHF